MRMHAGLFSHARPPSQSEVPPPAHRSRFCHHGYRDMPFTPSNYGQHIVTASRTTRPARGPPKKFPSRRVSGNTAGRNARHLPFRQSPPRPRKKLSRVPTEVLCVYQLLEKNLAIFFFGTIEIDLLPTRLRSKTMNLV